MRVMKEFEVKKILWFFFQPCSATWMKVLRKRSEGSQGEENQKIKWNGKNLGKVVFFFVYRPISSRCFTRKAVWKTGLE